MVLVGIVGCCIISKFSDPNTDAAHVQTCWKKARKVPNCRTKNILLSIILFCACFTSPISRNLKMKKIPFFYPGPSSFMPYLQGFSKNWCCKNYDFVRILQHFGLLLTCHWYVYKISNKGNDLMATIICCFQCLHNFEAAINNLAIFTMLEWEDKG